MLNHKVFLAIVLASVFAMASNLQGIGNSLAQDDTQYPPITASNVSRIQQVMQFTADYVTSVAWAPDGRTLAAGNQRDILLFDMENPTAEPRRLGSHFDAVRDVAFSPDGSMLASASDDNSVRVWDMANEQLLYLLEGEKPDISSVAFSPNGMFIGAGSSNGIVYVWSAQTGHLLNTFDSELFFLGNVTFSPDSRLIIAAGSDYAGGNDAALVFWTIATGERLQVLEGFSSHIARISYHPSTQTFLSVSDNVLLWDAISSRILREFEGSPNISTTDAAFSSDGSLLVGGGPNGVFRVWDVETGQLLALFGTPSSWITCVEFSPDSALIASGDTGGIIRLWGVGTSNSEPDTPADEAQTFQPVPESDVMAASLYLDEIYYSETLGLTFNYPSGWFVGEEEFFGFPLLANSREAWGAVTPTSGQIGIIFMNLWSETSPLEAAYYLLQLRLSDTDGPVANLPTPEKFVLAGRPAAYAEYKNDQQESLVIAVQTSEGVTWVMVAGAPPGELEQYKPIVFAIAETLNE